MENPRPRKVSSITIGGGYKEIPEIHPRVHGNEQNELKITQSSTALQNPSDYGRGQKSLRRSWNKSNEEAANPEPRRNSISLKSLMDDASFRGRRRRPHHNFFEN